MRLNSTIVDNCYRQLPLYGLYLAASWMGLMMVLILLLGILTIVSALKKKRMMETPLRTWVMNLDLITGGASNIYDQYEVFMDKTESEFRHFKDANNRSRSLVSLAPPREIETIKSRSKSNMETVHQRLERSNSDEEASFMLKVLNYPEIFYENQPPSKERKDSLLNQIKRKMSVSSNSTEALRQPSPSPTPSSITTTQDTYRPPNSFMSQPPPLPHQRVRQLRAASVDGAQEVLRRSRPPVLRKLQVNQVKSEDT